MARDGSFWDSALDAFRAGNIFLRFVLFVVFALITATPYLVFNLDKVGLAAKASGLSGFPLVWAFIKALTAATWKGLFIGLSTVFDTVINIGEVLGNGSWGTLFFSLMILLFATMTFFQPLRLFFNVIDMQKDRKHSRGFIFLISLVFVLVVMSSIAWLITGGETITSNVEDSEDEVDDLANMNGSINDTNSTVLNAIDMIQIDGGG